MNYTKKVIEAYDHLQINNVVMKRGVVESIRSCLESEVEVKYDKYKKKPMKTVRWKIFQKN